MALFLLVLFLNSASAALGKPKPDSVSPTWSADLHAAVGSLPLALVVGRGRETTLQPKTSLLFLGNNTIVATFVTQEGKPTLSGRDNSDPNQPLRLRGIFLEADTAKIISTEVWPSSSRFAGVVAGNDQGFVTQRGTELTLYSPSAKELKNLSLPALPEELWGWHAHPSLTGRSILFATSDLTPTTSPREWIWLDTTSLRITRSWEELQSGWIGISDAAMAMTACTIWFYHCEPSVEIRGITTEWKTIAPLEKRSQQFPQFVNKDVLFVSGEPWKLLQTDGKTVGSTCAVAGWLQIGHSVRGEDLSFPTASIGIDSTAASTMKYLDRPTHQCDGTISTPLSHFHAAANAVLQYFVEEHVRMNRLQAADFVQLLA